HAPAVGAGSGRARGCRRHAGRLRGRVHPLRPGLPARRTQGGRPMTRFRWLLATSLRGLRARWVLSLGSLLLTVIAIASAVVGPSYQATAANSFVIAQLRAEPRINTALTYDYRPRQGDTIDQAVVDALASTGSQSGPAYLPGHAIVWQDLGETSIPGADAG